jgi:sortase A
MVLNDDSSANLDRHACLVKGTPPVILGHRDTHFRSLRRIGMNDRLEIQRPDGRKRQYRVTEIEILPADRANQRLHEHRDADSLVLMTCHPFRYIGAAPDRFLVWVRPV